jgi:hypothetical protein
MNVSSATHHYASQPNAVRQQLSPSGDTNNQASSNNNVNSPASPSVNTQGQTVGSLINVTA